MNKLLISIIGAGILFSSSQLSFAVAANDIIHLNKADIAALEKIKGIGESKAKRIVDYRKQHGGFKTLADLTNVKGISEKTLARLQNKNPNMQL